MTVRGSGVLNGKFKTPVKKTAEEIDLPIQMPRITDAEGAEH